LTLLTSLERKTCSPSNPIDEIEQPGQPLNLFLLKKRQTTLPACRGKEYPFTKPHLMNIESW